MPEVVNITCISVKRKKKEKKRKEVVVVGELDGKQVCASGNEKLAFCLFLYPRAN